MLRSGFFRRIRIVALSSLAVVLVLDKPARAEPRTWVVRPGDVLSVLAKRFDIEVNQLRKLNELDDDSIRVGQELIVEPGHDQQNDSTEIYQVVKGDTLSGVAGRYGVSIDRLLELNPSVKPDKIFEGQKLSIGNGSRRITYRIQSGDTLSRIAAKKGVKVRDLVGWNAQLNPRRIRPGQRLVIYTKLPPSYSESVGSPNQGSLLHAEQLPLNFSYIIRDRDRAWGTEETITYLVSAFEWVHKRYPKTPKVMVHDLSYRSGGAMVGHHSHQSGRDVDISYFQQEFEGKACPFQMVSPGNLDLKRQWTLLQFWLRRKRVEAIFIDYRLQKLLYRYAKKKGATKEQLNEWFQYPRGRTFPLGVIRHYPKHSDHIHVRFICHKTDQTCKTFRPLLMRSVGGNSALAP